ncbi:unnamed protein product [Lactuca virosa]|uniref:Uncharacterized protein n=1 Tax=Lactuca virosa TaxID=75947 RepID=A0AAU9M6J6_9ASTR|nr:unnamed protein product [Lactuca virosa]
MDDVNPKVSIKPHVIKQDPKDKETLFSNEPIIDNDEDEEPDEAELKRRKAREAELDENARIFKEAEEKESAELDENACEAELDENAQYWLDPIASFDVQNSQDS